MLNNFKSEGDKNILETFKVRRAQLQAEEERQREAMARRSSRMGGSVPMFRLGGFGHRHEHQPSTAVGSSPTVGTESDSSDTLNSTLDQSWVQWIGSWIGWK